MLHITKNVEENTEQGKVWAERGCRALEGGRGVCNGRPKCSSPVLSLSGRVHRQTLTHTHRYTHTHEYIYIDANTHTHIHATIFISISFYMYVYKNHELTF